MADLTLADFSGTVGDRYELEAGADCLPLELSAAEALPHSPRPGGAFRLEFRGPFEPVLPQAIYSLRRGGAAYEIFIVPIAQEREGTRYEAVFF